MDAVFIFLMRCQRVPAVSLFLCAEELHVALLDAAHPDDYTENECDVGLESLLKGIASNVDADKRQDVHEKHNDDCGNCDRHGAELRFVVRVRRGKLGARRRVFRVLRFGKLPHG